MGPSGAHDAFGFGVEASKGLTWTPRIPNIMKKAQQMTTMFPMGFRDDMRVSTTSFSPWARLMTLWRQVSTKALVKKKQVETVETVLYSQGQHYNERRRLV